MRYDNRAIPPDQPDTHKAIMIRVTKGRATVGLLSTMAENMQKKPVIAVMNKATAYRA